MENGSKGSLLKLYFNINCTLFWYFFSQLKENLLFLFLINTYVRNFCVFLASRKIIQVLNTNSCSDYFCKENHRKETCFHKIVFGCFSQLSFDMNALKALVLLLIQLLKAFQVVDSVENKFS